jgi:hypothetical protein
MRRKTAKVAAVAACRSVGSERDGSHGELSAYAARVRIKLRPASRNASDHAQIAIDLARAEYDAALDLSRSLDLVDSLVR